MGIKKIDKEQVIKMYKEGLSMSEIGRRLGHYHGCIAFHLHRAKINIRPTYLRNPQVKTEDIIRLYEEGFNSVEIAKKFDLTHQSILERLARNKVKIRNSKEALQLMYKQGKLKIKSGKDNPHWKGGRHKNKDGYIDLRIDCQEIPEHRHIWEKHNGKLPNGWLVHHLNGIRDDNHIENLMAMPRKKHNLRLQFEPYEKRILKLEKAIWALKNAIKREV